MPNTKISVITPVLNCKNDIENCILSVCNQTIKDVEHIIIDGKSTDGTIEIIERYSQKYPHIIYISEKDKGIYDAMNKGIGIARSEFLNFLGADDVYYSNEVFRKILNYKEYDVIYGKVKFKTKNTVFGGEASLDSLKKKNIPHQAVFYRRSVFDKMGLYGNKYKISEDYVFNIKCFKETSLRKIFIDEVLVLFNDTASSSYIQDNFIKYRLHLFEELSIIDRVKKLYYDIRPEWFRPVRWLNAVKNKL